jgi:hypothetical protein
MQANLVGNKIRLNMMVSSVVDLVGIEVGWSQAAACILWRLRYTMGRVGYVSSAGYSTVYAGSVGSSRRGVRVTSISIFLSRCGIPL